MNPLLPDRLPPHSLEAERAVLACCIISPCDALPDCAASFQSESSVFYDLRHQIVYEALVGMYESRVPIETFTLAQWLKDRHQLESVGGISFLSTLGDNVHSAVNLGHYKSIVMQKHMLRRMLTLAVEMTDRVYEHEGDAHALLDTMQGQMLKLNENHTGDNCEAVHDLVIPAIEIIEARQQNQGKTSGLETGFIKFDEMTTGLNHGEMHIIAGRPSTGKTSLSLNIAEHVAVNLEQPVGIFSLEMMKEALMLRIISSMARVDSHHIRSGQLTDSDLEKIAHAGALLRKRKIFIDDTSGLSIMQMRAKARRMWQRHGIKLFVVDYLQLLHSEKARRDGRQQEISDISNGIKDLAKELKVPIVVLCQLNRESEKREGKPRMSDLRESGSLEQDADLVGLLYRANTENQRKAASPDDISESDAIPVNLLIAKQRNGPVGDVHLMFLKQFTRFENASPISDADVPPETNNQNLPYAD